MSIREVAKELYRLQKEVERLERLIEEEPQNREKLILELNKLKAQRDKVRAILEGMKRYPNIRRPR